MWLKYGKYIEYDKVSKMWLSKKNVIRVWKIWLGY